VASIQAICLESNSMFIWGYRKSLCVNTLTQCITLSVNNLTFGTICCVLCLFYILYVVFSFLIAL
jgi:hypothetical protein